MIRNTFQRIGRWLLFVLFVGCQRADKSEQSSLPSPTLAQVRLAYTAVHPALRITCDDSGDKLFSLDSPQNIIACVSGDAELSLQSSRTTTGLSLEQYSKDYYHFKAYVGAREVGIVLRGHEENDSVTPFYLLINDTRLAATLDGLTEGHFIALDDSTFQPAVRRILAHGPSRSGTVYFAPTTLNDKGYFLQQQGYPSEAQLFYNEVVRRYPDRAVAYLNRGDAYWQLGQPAAAQADYLHYLSLLRSQHRDTTHVPAYVHLILRLPQN